MDYLATEAYRVVDVMQALELLDQGGPPARTVGLSFDDGFLDVAEQALPLLAKRAVADILLDRVARALDERDAAPQTEPMRQEIGR